MFSAVLAFHSSCFPSILELFELLKPPNKFLYKLKHPPPKKTATNTRNHFTQDKQQLHWWSQKCCPNRGMERFWPRRVGHGSSKAFSAAKVRPERLWLLDFASRWFLDLSCNHLIVTYLRRTMQKIYTDSHIEQHNTQIHHQKTLPTSHDAVSSWSKLDPKSKATIGKGSTTLGMHRISKWIIIIISYLTNLKCQDSSFERHVL